MVCEDDLEKALAATNAPRALIVESAEILNEAEKAVIEKYKAAGGQVIWSQSPTWFKDFPVAAKTPTVVMDGQPTTRVIVRDQGKKTIVHILNLNVERLSSFTDRVKPATDVHFSLHCAGEAPRSVTALSADPDATRGAIQFTTRTGKEGSEIELMIPRVTLSTILVIE